MDKMIQEFIKKYCHSKDSNVCLLGPMLKQMPNGLDSRAGVFFIDGACRFRREFSGQSLSIGDGDSSSADQMDCLLPTQKDQSDLSYLLQNFNYPYHLSLYGLMGGRLDHQLAVLGECSQFTQRTRGQCQLFDEQNQLKCLIGDKIDFEHHGTFSVLSFTAQLVTIQGKAQYQIQSQVMSSLSALGLSNQADGSVTVLADQPVIVIFEDD